MKNDLGENDTEKDNFIESVGGTLNSAFVGVPSIGSIFLLEEDTFDMDIAKIRRYVKKEKDEQTIIAMKDIIIAAMKHINGKNKKWENKISVHSSKNLINFNSSIEELLYEEKTTEQKEELICFLKETLKSLEDQNIKNVEKGSNEKNSISRKLLSILSFSLGNKPQCPKEKIKNADGGVDIDETLTEEELKTMALDYIHKYAKSPKVNQGLKKLVEEALEYMDGEEEQRRGVAIIPTSTDIKPVYTKFKRIIEIFNDLKRGTEDGDKKIIAFLNELIEELEKL